MRPRKAFARNKETEAKRALYPPGANRFLAPFVPFEGSGALNRNECERRKRKVIALVGEGMGVQAAYLATGTNAGAYRNWRYLDPEFAAAVDYAKKNEVTSEEMNRETFASFRKRYFGFDSYYHHLQIIDAIENAEPMTVTLVLVPPEFGKGLALDTPVPTPTGWTTMGDLKVGTVILDADGNPTTVTFVSPVHHRPCYEVVFSDRSSVIADDQHLWLTRTRKPQRSQSVKSTAEIAGTTYVHGRPNHGVPVAKAWQLPEAELPVDPYVLGAWLGDGASDGGRIYGVDTEIFDEIRFAGYELRPMQVKDGCPAWSVVGLSAQLRQLGVRGNKHIPLAYLRASEKQRLALMEGLMDTDGSCTAKGLCEFTSVNRALATGVLELARTLGFKPRMYEGRASVNGKDCGPKYRVCFMPRQPVFRLARKYERQLSDVPNDRDKWETIIAVTPVETVPTVCIQVDNPRSLFLAGSSPKVTHNTTVLVDYVNFRFAYDPNLRVTVVSEGEGHAKKFVGRVARRMTDTDIAPLYIETFGPFKPEERTGKPWAATHFTLEQANVDQADFSLEARGAGSAVYGTRSDLMIFDDIQSRSNLNQTDKLLASIRQDFLSRPGRLGKVVIIGTRVDVGDVYEKMLDEGIIDRLVQLPATNPVDVTCHKALAVCELDHPDCCGLHWADGSVIPHEDSMAPEMWDNHSLAKRRRQVGNPTWLRSYQQRPEAAGNATFDEQMIENAKEKLRLVGVHSSSIVGLSLDPALGGQMSLLCAGLSTEKLEVIDLITQEGLGRVEQILFFVEQFANLYHPKFLMVETDTLQKGLARDERLREMAQQKGFMVLEHRTAGQKADLNLGVAMMATTFSKGECSIPWGDALAQRRMAVLVDELRAWRAQVATRSLRQDTVMTLWFIWKYWQEIRPTLEGNVGDVFSHAGLPWKRMSATKALTMQKRAS